MRTFEQLDKDEQAQALQHFEQRLLGWIIEGGYRFNDEANDDDVQARIDAALARADEAQTPWFAAEFLYDDAAIREVVESLVSAEASDALYAGPDDPEVVTL